MAEVDLKALKRQAEEAEALVRQLERGEAATVKQSSQSYLSKAAATSHGGYAGKSLIEKIRDDIRETIGEYESLVTGDENVEYLDGLLDGMCHALAVLRGNDGETERNWAESEWLVMNRVERAKAQREAEQEARERQEAMDSVPF